MYDMGAEAKESRVRCSDHNSRPQGAANSWCPRYFQDMRKLHAIHNSIMFDFQDDSLGRRKCVSYYLNPGTCERIF